MRQGDVIAERFVLDREVSVGGMGRIYRADDRHLGGPVAIKVLATEKAETRRRLLSEASILAGLHHPGIVRYVDHGRLSGGMVYLAMEWLEGEDLGVYLARRRPPQTPRPRTRPSRPGVNTSPLPLLGRIVASDLLEPTPGARGADATSTTSGLTLSELLTLGRRVAAATAELHRRGIIHCDIKPSNLFLAGGALDQVKLIDFGIAHGEALDERITRTGTLVGTPHYMAPEQARARGDVIPATDIWAIGCVLYRCLTGVRPFEGGDVVAVLTRIVLDQPVPLDVVRPDLPVALTELVTRMLSKDPALRPADGAALLAALSEIDDREGLGEDLDIEVDDDEPPTIQPTLRRPHRAPTALTGDENRVTCMLLIDRGQVSEAERVRPSTRPRMPPIRAISTSSGDSGESAEIAAAVAEAAAAEAAMAKAEAAFHEVAAPLGGQVQTLIDGTILVTVPQVHVPGDQAVCAARVALALRQRDPSLRMALATGRARGGRAAADVSDAAARNLRAAAPGEIRLDAITAGLVSARFELDHRAGAQLLSAEADQGAARTLLGRPSQWVGRRRELGTLLATFDECAEEQQACAVLVTASPGMGKSRLYEELTEALRQRGENVLVMLGRGDAVGAGAPFAMIGPALRRMAGIYDGEDEVVARDKLRGLVSGIVAPERTALVTTFLGELIGVRFDEDAHDALRAARRDPAFANECMQSAWIGLLDAACQRSPVLLILDDLHWGDRPSVEYVDAALELCADRALMVLALARSEIAEMFPRLWARRNLLEMPLSPLSGRACARLVREALGDRVDDATVDTIVTRAGGNAFYLEEMVRLVAEGGSEQVPDSVLGMVQARLDALSPEARLILRAASVFGETFWQDGVQVLVGEDSEFGVDAWLDELCERELIRRAATSRLPGQREYEFRHDLMREAAYAMLTDDDRRLGHALAGAWLEDTGGADSRGLAEHFLRGGDSARALGHFERAARQALEAHDDGEALRLVERAIEVGAGGEALGRLYTIQAAAYYLGYRHTDCTQAARAALPHLPRYSQLWFQAMGHAISAAMLGGNQPAAATLYSDVRDATAAPGAEGEQIVCLSRTAYHLFVIGATAEAEPILERIDDLERDGPAIDTRLLAQLNSTRALAATYRGDFAAVHTHLERAMDAFERAGDLVNLASERNFLALSWLQMGRYDLVEKVVHATLALIGTRRRRVTHHLADLLLGLCRLHRGEPPEQAMTQFDAGVAGVIELGHRGMASIGLVRWTLEALAGGRKDEAEAMATRAVSITQGMRSAEAEARAALALVLVADNRNDEAQVQADNAMAASIGGMLSSALLPPLALAEVRRATGDLAGAYAVIAATHTELQRRLATITDERSRAAFLEVPHRRRLCILAKSWLKS
ncbi:serine/threonine-protein kinase PknK [Haliangium sp.]|uniref:serine/threonine-protein kinase n=1 Tax=Haliangium sp. TaxID=2663208 RepID=UPI003D10B247